MIIEIEIPKEFEGEFNIDRFEETFERVRADMGCTLCGNYEVETVEMLKIAFEKSKVK